MSIEDYVFHDPDLMQQMLAKQYLRSRLGKGAYSAWLKKYQKDYFAMYHQQRQIEEVAIEQRLP